MKTRVIGIVGQIGAGKSTVRELLVKRFEYIGSDFRIGHLDLDIVSKELFKTIQNLRAELVDNFGPIMVSTDFSEKRDYVLNNLFTSDQKYTVLNQILGKYILPYLATIIKRNEYDILIIEGVLLSHFPVLTDLCHSMIQLVCPQTVCRKRVDDRGHYTVEQVNTLLKRTDITYFNTIGNTINHYINSNGTREDGPLFLQNQVDDIVELEIRIIGKEMGLMYDEPTDINININVTVTEEVPTKLKGPGVSVTITNVNDYQPPGKKLLVLYAGSFNPFHFGHLGVVHDILKIFPEVLILKCVNGGKINSEEIDLLMDEDALPEGSQMMIWRKAFVDFLEAFEDEYDFVIARGIRNGADLDYETSYIQHLTDQYQIRGKELPPVIYIPCRPEYKHISSSAIKAILPFDEDYARMMMI